MKQFKTPLILFIIGALIQVSCKDMHEEKYSEQRERVRNESKVEKSSSNRKAPRSNKDNRTPAPAPAPTPTTKYYSPTNGKTYSKPVFLTDQLFKAVEKGNISKAKELLNSKQKLDINSQRYDDGKTALHIASAKNNVPMVRLIISKKASKTIKDNNGDTALHIAAKNGNMSVAVVLSDNVSLSIKNNDGRTAAQVAQAFGHNRVRSYLEQEYRTYNSR